MKSFFGGSQVDIFRGLAHEYKAYSRNTQFLREETKTAIEEVNAILSLEKPYSQVRQLPMLEKKIKASIQEALSAQKKEVRESLDVVTKELKKDLSDEMFSDDFRESVLGLFNVVKRTIKDAEDCVLVQSQLPMINSLRAEAYGLIDVEIKSIRDPLKRITERINKISFFESGKVLKNETDIEEYIIQLREKLLKIIEEKNIRV